MPSSGAPRRRGSTSGSAVRPFDVINNAGAALYPRGFSGDRGFLERDAGQYDTSQEVFGFSGGAVVLARAMVDDVGLFDERLFLYYEDTDLAWRGRRRGWRYVYVPTAVVRHRHASSTVIGSPVFRFHTERNRPLVLAKNAPAAVALRAGARRRRPGRHRRQRPAPGRSRLPPTAPGDAGRPLAAPRDGAPPRRHELGGDEGHGSLRRPVRRPTKPATSPRRAPLPAGVPAGRGPTAPA